jgi:TPP-dependent pyruvate/acetoin dehydrogenase alpha subunit
MAAKKHLDSNKGPVFMHVKCLRYLQHCGINSDISAVYRNPHDILEVQQNDTFDKLCKYIKKNKLNINTNKVDDEIEREVQEAIKFAKSSPHPSKKDLLESVYYE